jgi:hypothetical protein
VFEFVEEYNTSPPPLVPHCFGATHGRVPTVTISPLTSDRGRAVEPRKRDIDRHILWGSVGEWFNG